MIFETDSYLEPFKDKILERSRRIREAALCFSPKDGKISSFANGHLYYTPHREVEKFIFREWAPNASRIFVTGDFNNWQRREMWEMHPVGGGDWELAVDEDLVKHGDLYKLYIEWPGGHGDRIPSYATRCVQDPDTKLFSAQVWTPSRKFSWRHRRPEIKNPLIYEVHIGMSSEEEKVASFDDFRKLVLPRVIASGYNSLQIMALQEHPYYGSFGYQVSNFFALSSRFGTPEEFKHLVDEAHRCGIAVIMDIVHSHAVSNEAEGLSRFDGSYTTYFHDGERGHHPAWGSRCFDYGKSQTLHFLLSNLKFWMEEYHLDGFRFDGVTSMLYYDHGLGKDFTDYRFYFDGGQDEDAIVYLGLANKLVKELNPKAFTIAEDMSGMPGLAAPLSQGGIGFDYRMSMGIADHWIKWIKDRSDWEWSMGEIFYELSNKRSDERTISYSECHDQALVGDKTIIFRLIDKEMYTSMSVSSESIVVDRGIALHKMIRMATICTAGDGYLNFMGNEFGHPEWIDFPREGNGWSCFYARRQWSLADNDSLKYKYLQYFDREMINLFLSGDLFKYPPVCLRADEEKKVLLISRGNYIFAFNFNPENSFQDYGFEVDAGEYEAVLDSDSGLFGGFGRNDCSQHHFTMGGSVTGQLQLYLPCRTVQVLRKL